MNDFKEKIQDILNNPGSDPVILAYNKNGRINLEIADSLEEKSQSELADKIFKLIEEYYK